MNPTPERRLRRFLARLATLIAVITFLVFPAGYLFTLHSEKQADLQALADRGADRLSEFIYLNARTWRLQEHRLEDLLYRLSRSTRTVRFRLVGSQGREIIWVGDEVQRPVLAVSAVVTDGIATLARLEVQESLRPLLSATLGVALFSLLLGLSMFSVLRVLPMRAFRRTLVSLKASRAALREEIRAKEAALEQAHEVGEAMRHLAHHDPLSALPNRLLFMDRLEQAVQKAARAGDQLAVLFIDLDHFKRINDSLGHQVGDNLLLEVARRLESVVRHEDTVSRFGGDEFTLLMDGLHRSQDAGLLVRKLMDCFVREFAIGDHQFHLSTSIGISLYPQDGSDAETLIRNADTAMYRAKDEGRNGFAFYNETMTQLAVRRVEMEASLRTALKEQTFVLYYQPQMCLASGALVGAEALIRWQHPAKGLIPPAEFIPLAEETGQIVAVGEWVLETACRQLRSWRDAGLFDGRLAVNLSGVQLQQESLLEAVKAILGDTGCQGDWLELEVSEGFIMQRAELSLGLLRGFRDLGCSLAIDDFGIGYSSLSYLKRLPVTKLKIDRSLIGDIPDDTDDQAIVRAVITLAHSLQLQVIAEGVETGEQEAFLRSQGCDQVQGYRYGRPVPALVFAERFLGPGAAAMRPPQ